MLFSSHILSEVQKLCDRVAIIKDGTIITVEQIRTLLENATKRFTLADRHPGGREPVPHRGCQRPGRLTDHSVSFLFRGHINEMTRLLAQVDLLDMQVVEPDLEEIFLHYYQKEE